MGDGPKTGTEDKTLVIFVHGFLSDDSIWDSLHALCEEDEDLSAAADFVRYDYSENNTLATELKAIQGSWVSIGRNEGGIASPFEDLAHGLDTEFKTLVPSYRSFMLICHSLGGLVARQYALRLLDRKSVLPARMLFLSTPHQGTLLGKVATLALNGNPLLRLLARNSSLVRELNREWREHHLHKYIRSFCYWAGKDRIVTKESALELFGVRKEDREVFIKDDHNTIYAIRSRSDKRFRHIKSCILECGEQQQWKDAALGSGVGLTLKGRSIDPGEHLTPTPVDSALNREQEERKRGDAALSAQVSRLQTQNEELKLRLAQLEMRLPQAPSADRPDILHELRRFRKASQLFAAGLKAYRRADYREALNSFESSSKLFKNWSILSNMAITYDMLCRFDEAISTYGEAESLLPESAISQRVTLIAYRADAFDSLGRYEEALEELQRAERMLSQQNLPLPPEFLYFRAVHYGNRGRFREALIDVEAAQERVVNLGRPPDPHFTTGRGWLHWKLGEFAKAEEHFRRADELRRTQKLPLSPTLATDWGALLVDLGRPEEALKHFKQAELLYTKQGTPAHPDFFLYRARAHLATGDLVQACMDAKAARSQAQKLKMPEPDELNEALTAACGHEVD